jgi:thiosulfate/3-mercaptopyruvate sulfurtransferase
MEPLVSTTWLADALAGATPPAVLDATGHLPAAAREARAEFTAAHIPGARFLDLASLADRDSPVPAAPPSPAQFAERMEELGIGDGAEVVLYDDSASRTAARVWFIFRLHGWREVAILDGGLGKWRAERRPLERGEAENPRSTAGTTPRAAAAVVRNKAEMLANLATGAEQVLDAREAGRFTGELPDIRPGTPAGHIPGSLNLPYGELLNPDGTYKDRDALRSAVRAAGVDLARPVVTTCGSGVTAAVLVFALHLLGKEDVALYDGSWAEWGADPATPKALGPA